MQYSDKGDLFDIDKWLTTECLPSEVKKIDGASYIPIGIIEEKLDKFHTWSTSNFKFTIYKAGNTWIASGSVELDVEHPSRGLITRVGAVSFQISSHDDNQDFEGTALSFCIANAAKKLGKTFGRHLNGRLDTGETALPIIQTKKGAAFDGESDAEWSELVTNLMGAQYMDEAQDILDKSSFKYTVEAKRLIQNKPVRP